MSILVHIRAVYATTLARVTVAVIIICCCTFSINYRTFVYLMALKLLPFVYIAVIFVLLFHYLHSLIVYTGLSNYLHCRHGLDLSLFLILLLLFGGKDDEESDKKYLLMNAAI